MEIYKETDRLKSDIQKLINEYKSVVGDSVIVDVNVDNFEITCHGDSRPRFGARVSIQASLPSLS